MNYRFEFIDKSGADFASLKADGVKGAIFSERFADKDCIAAARKNKLKIFFHLSDFEKISCLYLEQDGVRGGELYAVTPEKIKILQDKNKDIMELVDGYIIPFPCVKGLFFKYELENACEDFYDRDLSECLEIIFNKNAEASEIRKMYYSGAEAELFYDYVMPSVEYVKSVGKEACFNLGNVAEGIDCVKKLIDPFLFLKHGIPVIYENNGQIVFQKGKVRNRGVLLVLPMRAIMMGYAWQMPFSRRETPFALALAEEEYYKIKLEENGIDYSVIGEAEFFDMKISDLKKFKNILICDACMLSEKEKGRVMKLKSEGILINNRELLNIFDREN